MDESDCTYVSSRGLLKSCDHRNRDPQSSNKHIDADLLDNLHEYDTVHVCSWLTISRFVKEFVPRLTKPVIMVTNDSDMDAPIFEKPVGPDDRIEKELIAQFLDSDLCVHWFTQNATLRHPKVSPIPIGLEYHVCPLGYAPWQQEAALLNIRANGRPFYERTIRCYGSFHFGMEGKYYTKERKECYEQVPRDLVYYEPQRVIKYQSWINQLNFAFVLSPPGMGIDCHRTWESLMLGCIPIVLRMSVHDDELYADLPVLLVERWTDITRELLENTVLAFKSRAFNYGKLKLKYWLDLIDSKRVANK